MQCNMSKFIEPFRRIGLHFSSHGRTKNGTVMYHSLVPDLKRLHDIDQLTAVTALQLNITDYHEDCPVFSILYTLLDIFWDIQCVDISVVELDAFDGGFFKPRYLPNLQRFGLRVEGGKRFPEPEELMWLTTCKTLRSLDLVVGVSFQYHTKYSSLALQLVTELPCLRFFNTNLALWNAALEEPIHEKIALIRDINLKVAEGRKSSVQVLSLDMCDYGELIDTFFPVDYFNLQTLTIP